MKEYENQTLEELRCADYMANRKGPTAGGTTATATGGTGLFGAAPNQTAPASGGLFGSTATTQQNSLFGSNQQQNKPLFGTTGGTGGFGQPTSAFGQTAGTGFGAQNTTANTGGGLFGAKPAGAFGATTTTSSGFGGFGGATNTATNMFGQPQNQNTAFGAAKPFGAAAPQTSQPLFGSNTGGFGTQSTPAFGSTAGAGFGQPQQQQNSSIGLFGQQNQAKPFGFGGGTSSFGSTATTTTTPSFNFGGATNTFGAQQQKPPAFGATTGTAGGFGATTGGFGAGTSFGAAQPQQNNMFGNNAAKPAFGGFSSTGTFGTATPSFGGTTTGFGGTNTGGGLFGNNQAQKPGGLFGNTGTSFGAGTSFGGAGTSFGNTGTSNFSFNSTQPSQNQPQNQQQPQISLQSQLASLTGNPYGDNPLFKNLLPDQNRREEMLKPTNPAAQKAALSSGTPYKVSPHLKAAKVKAIQKNSANKSAIFDGLDEDTGTDTGDIFVPRSSVKKLVLKPKIPAENQDEITVLEKTGTAAELEESLNLPLKPLKTVKTVQVEVHDESFSNLVTKTRSKELDESSILTPPESANTSQELTEETDEPQPAGIRLRRAGYYTIPSMSELATMVDPETGNCTVENFTIGRQGYGNVFFPGLTNIKNMNFDDIVFFRHKEVIVYPDDSKKPELGSGLNKKAQVTLGKSEICLLFKILRRELTKLNLDLFIFGICLHFQFANKLEIFYL